MKYFMREIVVLMLIGFALFPVLYFSAGNREAQGMAIGYWLIIVGPFEFILAIMLVVAWLFTRYR